MKEVQEPRREKINGVMHEYAVPSGGVYIVPSPEGGGFKGEANKQAAKELSAKNMERLKRMLK